MMLNSKKIVLFSLISLAPIVGLAFELGSGLIPPSQQKVILNYTGLFHESAQFPQGNAAISYQMMDFSSPVYRSDGDSLSLSLGGNQLSIKPAQSNYSELYDLKFGLAYTKAIDEKRLWSVSARYGSASDKPFEDSSVTTFGLTALYSFPDDETGRWLLLLDYSNNRPILNNIPLPGFAYFYQPSKEFRAVFGAPFASLNWQYSEKWGLEVFTLVPWIFKGSVSYKLNDFAKVYSGVDFSQITYYLYGRQNIKERLFFDEKKIFVGFKSPLSKNILFEFEIGHAFDRALFVAENYSTHPDMPLNIGDAAYAKLALKLFY